MEPPSLNQFYSTIEGDIMNPIDSLIAGNAAFAATMFDATLKIMPTKKMIILACADPRVDPADIFGLVNGDAAVIRNVGGRVGPATLETMALLRSVVQDRGGDIGAGWNFVVLHHTDCGIKNCRNHAPDLLARHMGVKPMDLATLAIDDPYESVVLDIAALKANPNLPASLSITGIVYDVATGIARIVVPTAPLRVESGA
jgi:carbonic anhydrase